MNETNVSGSVQPELINSLGFNAGPILSAEMMLSMICLIITCVIYLKLPELRNVPGKIVISICSCLFFTYLFLIMDFSMRKSGNSISCMVIGFFVHFSFMAVFIWTNVMSFDIWKTLKCMQPGKVSESEQTRRFIKYSIYSWVISLVLTVPVFVFDNIEAIPEYYKPKFGRKRCWLSGTTAFLIYFNLPVGLTLFANLIFFVHTVIVLRRLKEQTKMLNVKRNENRLRLSLKLLVIMGLIWFTEYLPWITGVYPLYLLSGMLTCLYGVFLFILFVCKKRIWKLIRDNFKCCWHFKFRCCWSTTNNLEGSKSSSHTKSSWFINSSIETLSVTNV